MSEDKHEKMVWVCMDLFRNITEQQHVENSSNIKGNKK